MLIPIAGLLALITFVVLTRLLWLNVRPLSNTVVVTLITAILIISLATLALSGRLSWVVAAGAALLPFLRRGFGMLRYLPWMRQLFSAYQQRKGSRPHGQQQRPDPASGAMTRTRALDILGLKGNPSKEEVVLAHRRLMQKLHPDRGGSTYLAQQLNEAKKTLLQRG